MSLRPNLHTQRTPRLRFGCILHQQRGAYGVDLAMVTAQQIGGMAWNAVMTGVGMSLAATGANYLHLIDKGFPALLANNPEAAAKEVRTFRILGFVLGLCGLAFSGYELLGIEK